MPTIEEISKLKRLVETLKRDADRAAGAYEQELLRLKEEFGVDSLEEAQGKLQEMKGETEQMEVDFERKFQTFKDEWGPKLGI